MPIPVASIVAIASATGRGAVGIVRVAGPAARVVMEAVCARTLQPRQASFLPFLDAQGVPIDQGLAIFFAAPASYTGDDVLELQAHGGAVVLQLLVARCLEAGMAQGLRLARPGEFTERAFLNDKLDLAQAEAVADLIDASTEAAARAAARSLAGVFSREVTALADELLDLRSLVEATLDFPEEDIDFVEAAQVGARVAAVRAQLAQTLARAGAGVLLRDGLRVVLAGAPNVGKSSLLNALAGAELAIVSPIPGTTRDRVSDTIQIEGVPLHVVDTAGLRDTDDAVERLGIERSWASVAEADIVVLLRDASQYDADTHTRDEQLSTRLRLHAPRARRVVVLNKADLAPQAALALQGQLQAQGEDALVLSARTHAGLDALRKHLLILAGWTADQHGAEGAVLARTRHIDALRRTDACLQAAQEGLAQPSPALDLLAEELRLAHRALGAITGVVDADTLLGAIFGRFCIGK